MDEDLSVHPCHCFGNELLNENNKDQFKIDDQTSFCMFNILFIAFTSLHYNTFTDFKK